MFFWVIVLLENLSFLAEATRFPGPTVELIVPLVLNSVPGPLAAKLIVPLSYLTVCMRSFSLYANMSMVCMNPNFQFWSHLTIALSSSHNYSGSNNYLIPCWFCRFAHLQRMKLYNFNNHRYILTLRDRISQKIQSNNIIYILYSSFVLLMVETLECDLLCGQVTLIQLHNDVTSWHRCFG